MTVPVTAASTIVDHFVYLEALRVLADDLQHQGICGVDELRAIALPIIFSVQADIAAALAYGQLVEADRINTGNGIAGTSRDEQRSSQEDKQQQK